MKNDISLAFHEELNLYGHQSTECPNMPLRGFLYIGRLYEKLVKDAAIYSSKKVMIRPPRKDQNWSLSAFNNINYKKNGEILTKCPVLKEYSRSVENVRKSQKRLPLQEAIREAIIIGKEQGILKDYLQTNGSVVENMFFMEYSREKDIEVDRREAWEGGKEEGKKRE